MPAPTPLEVSDRILRESLSLAANARCHPSEGSHESIGSGDYDNKALINQARALRALQVPNAIDDAARQGLDLVTICSNGVDRMMNPVKYNVQLAHRQPHNDTEVAHSVTPTLTCGVGSPLDQVWM